MRLGSGAVFVFLLRGQAMHATSTLPTDTLWTIEDVARYLRIHVNTARAMHSDGRIPHGQKIGRRWLWEPDALKTIVCPPIRQEA
jgi:excisionase family DNA binding protein